MFEWKDDYSVKVPLLDAQHKKLFEIGGNVYTLLQNHSDGDSFSEIIVQVKELIKYAKYHFEQEEALMRKYDFQELNAHILEHTRFIDYLDSLDYNEIDANQLQALEDMVQFLAKWIFKHIINTDFKYSDHIEKGLQSLTVTH